MPARRRSHRLAGEPPSPPPRPLSPLELPAARPATPPPVVAPAKPKRSLRLPPYAVPPELETDMLVSTLQILGDAGLLVPVPASELPTVRAAILRTVRDYRASQL